MSDVVLDGLDYPVVFCEDAAASLPRLIVRGRSAPRALVIADRRLGPRARACALALTRAGARVIGVRLLRGGERCKSVASLDTLWQLFAALRADRSTLVVALGGGTITDVAGFAAATYMRGLPWAAVATTVLGMADAAIGGKTAIDLAAGKNLAGAFWPPRAVLADLKALRTLPLVQRATGLAEIVKAAIVGDPALLDAVESFDAARGTQESWAQLIVRAAAVKVNLVASDPYDRGPRAALNLGHTVGHALEHVAAGRLSHGAAVSVGLRAAGLLALGAGMYSAQEHARVLRALARSGLPLSWSGARRVVAVEKALALDKKRDDGTIRFVLPERFGSVRIGVAVEPSVLRTVIKQCAAPPQSEEFMK